MFDGRGFKDTGEYCSYVGPATGCTTNLVYFDGTALKDLVTSTSEGAMCPSVSNALYFDGTGMKTTFLAGTCGAPFV
jgi:hypothetical protein